MATASALPVYSLNAPASLPGVAFSDHSSYWNEGFDAIMITDTAYFRNRRYHTDYDTPETLDYRRMAMAVQGVYAAVIQIANWPISPWNSANLAANSSLVPHL
jgi:hypothetical protein